MTEASYLTAIELRRLLQLSDLRSYRDSAVSRHRLVMGLFPKGLADSPRAELDALFRLEKNSRQAQAIVRSSTPPVALPGVTTMREDFSSLEAGALVTYRATVSPLLRRQGREHYLQEFEEVEEWLHHRVAGALERVELITLRDETVPRTHQAPRRGGSFIKLVQIDGVAQVKNADALEDLLRSGIGRNKNYGAGLLTARRIG